MTHRSVQAGTAFRPDYGTVIGSPPIRPGTEMGWLYVYLDDASKSTLVMNSVGISGLGVGTVVRVAALYIAPLRTGYHNYHIMDATPGGTYMTSPPVNIGGRGCHKQALFPVAGYQMQPGSQVRIYIVLGALRPGKYSVPSEHIYYTIRGVKYRQSTPIRLQGSVAERAPSLRVDPAEAVCVKPSGARLLPGWTLSSGR